MKFNKIFLSLAAGAMLVGASACTEEVEYTPAQPAPLTDYYFPTTNPTEQDLVDGDDSFVVTVCRPTAGAATTLAIESSVTPDNPFTIPSSVTFEEGKTSATLKVEFDLQDLTVNQDYIVKLTIPGIENTPYSYGSIDIKVLYLPWRAMEGKALYRDATVCGLYGFEPVTYEVEMQQHPTIDGIYRLVNPYAPGVFPYGRPSYYDATKDHYVVIDARNPKQVFVEESATGWIDPQDGEMTILSWSNMLLEENPAEAIEKSGLFAYLENGIIRYPDTNPNVKQAILAYFESDPEGLYIGNKGNLFKVVLPGFEDEPEWEEVGMCDYTDGFVGPFIGVKDNTYKVLVEHSLLNEDVYRMVNPYGPESGYVTEVPESPEYIEFSVEDPDFVYFGEYEPGIQVNAAGNFLICASYPYVALSYMQKPDGSRYTVAELKAAGFGGKFADGVLRIPGDETCGLNVTPQGQIAGLLTPSPQNVCDIVLDMSNPTPKEETPAATTASVRNGREYKLNKRMTARINDSVLVNTQLVKK